MTKHQILLYWSHEDQAFSAEVPELPGCAAGPSRHEALETGLSIRMAFSSVVVLRIHVQYLVVFDAERQSPVVGYVQDPHSLPVVARAPEISTSRASLTGSRPTASPLTGEYQELDSLSRVEDLHRQCLAQRPKCSLQLFELRRVREIEEPVHLG
jgi:hypothetical protein